MKTKITISSLLTLIFLGCGGGSGSQDIVVGTGYYIDSAVEGVEYKCGIESGITNNNGAFKFQVGKECRFYINGHQFKKTKKFTKDDHDKEFKENKTDIARFLMTLDSDGNPENGITITRDIAKQVDMVALDSGELNKLGTKLRSVTGYQGKVFSINEAEDHIKGQGLKPIINVSAKTITQGDTITLDASSSTGKIKNYLWNNGSKALSTQESFSTNSLTVGKHTISLTITDVYGNQRGAEVLITVNPKPSKWYKVEPIDQNGTTKLYVTSDEENLYFKLEGADFNRSQIFLDSDNSRISGIESSTWSDMGVDFIIRNDAVYHYEKDFDDRVKTAQNSSFVQKDGYIEVAIDKNTIIKYNDLAKDMKVSLFGTVNLPESGKGAKFSDSYYIDQTDIYPPIIKVAQSFIVATDANYTTPTATAFDVEDKNSVTVSTKDEVDTATVGYYTVLFSAKDSAGNESNASTIVQIVGQKSGYEVKKLGAMNEDVVIDNDNELVWSNDDTFMPIGVSRTRGCLFLGERTTKNDAKTIIDRYCKASTYGGFTDWRVPTPDELSYFTVRMIQEGKKIGLGKKHCVQLVAQDNSGNIKSVWTQHKKFNGAPDRESQPFAGYIDSEFAFPAGFRCVRGPKNRINFQPFVVDLGKIDENKTLTYTDSNGKKLMWVNEFNEANRACKAIHKNTNELNESKDFCKNLNYAGHNDWRYPTSAELSEFIKETNKAHVFVGYEAPCGRLIARDDNATGSTYKFVVSRYGAKPINPNGTSPIGTIKELEIPIEENIGLRCVREAL